jgi:hypothetical protein
MALSAASIKALTRKSTCGDGIGAEGRRVGAGVQRESVSSSNGGSPGGAVSSPLQAGHAATAAPTSRSAAVRRPSRLTQHFMEQLLEHGLVLEDLGTRASEGLEW